MAWSHLDIDKPHLAYMILGGFTSLFMLCSLLVKEKLYIGEATVATLVGVIFGPAAADLVNPISWGNVDKITLEFSRVVLVVQCFAVGVELPKAYMERHWKSVTLLLLPVMTWGWLITSLLIWWMVPSLNWLESLACSACVTATDPVLASSVVGKGKFAKRVPKHLRDLLSAESGCNDGMAFPFIYLSLYIMRYRPDASKVAEHWIVTTILYECILGAVFGFAIGYAGRHAIKYSEKKNLIDRESFLVFYFVLALFCAGTGSLLGMDDLLMGFSAGVGFSNDGWFSEKTEESHVSNVIDLLLNLTYFVYFGAIIPWGEFNAPELGIIPWRLVVLALLVLLFRRIPIILLLKPIIPDVKTWREALFAGHFGPIGVGAIYACILTRAELENKSTQPSDVLPKPGEHNYVVISVIWPITTFLVITSILVHGSSIAVFTLGKRINTLTITMSYTQANDEGPSWMNRLPRLSKPSLSLRKDSFESSKAETTEFPPGTLGPIGVSGNLLRRQKEDEGISPAHSRSSSLRPIRRRKQGAGGPVSESAITPQWRQDIASPESHPTTQAEVEVFREGHKLVIEDEEGNVLETRNIAGLSPGQQDQMALAQQRRISEDQSGHFAESGAHPHEERTQGDRIEAELGNKLGHPYENVKGRFASWKGFGKKPKEADTTEMKTRDRGRRSARAYQYANTVIVEDDQGEVIKKYTISPPSKQQAATPETGPENKPGILQQTLSKMGNWGGRATDGKPGEPSTRKPGVSGSQGDDEDEDKMIRFTVPEGSQYGLSGRRMSKQDFIDQIQRLPPRTRHEVSANELLSGFKHIGRSGHHRPTPGPENLNVPRTDRHHESSSTDTPLPPTTNRRDSEDDGSERIPPAQRRAMLAGIGSTSSHAASSSAASQRRTMAGTDEDSETPAERKRRLAALGQFDSSGSLSREPDSEDEGEFRTVKGKVQFADGTRPAKKRSPPKGTRPVPHIGDTESPATPSPSYPSPVVTRGADPAETDNQDGTNENEHETESGNGNGGGRVGHRSRISWGGERGRDA